jgi:hypothetical protein
VSSSPRQPVPWRALIAAAGIAGGEGTAEIVRPELGEALALIDVIGPMMIALILITAILRGSDETVDRVFRLLRWAVNRPEPEAPASSGRPGRSGKSAKSATNAAIVAPRPASPKTPPAPVAAGAADRRQS